MNVSRHADMSSETNAMTQEVMCDDALNVNVARTMAPSPPLLTSAMTEVNTAPMSDAALVADLRPRLKVPRSSDMPQTEHVDLAMRIARDPPIVTSKGFWPAHIKSSATRTRIKALATRMVDEGHLAAAEMALAKPAKPNATRVNFGLGDQYNTLLVPQTWLEQNTLQ